MSDVKNFPVFIKYNYGYGGELYEEFNDFKECYRTVFNNKEMSYIKSLASKGYSINLNINKDNILFSNTNLESLSYCRSTEICLLSKDFDMNKKSNISEVYDEGFKKKTLEVKDGKIKIAYKEGGVEVFFKNYKLSSFGTRMIAVDKVFEDFEKDLRRVSRRSSFQKDSLQRYSEWEKKEKEKELSKNSEQLVGAVDDKGTEQKSNELVIETTRAQPEQFEKKEELTPAVKTSETQQQSKSESQYLKDYREKLRVKKLYVVNKPKPKKEIRQIKSQSTKRQPVALLEAQKRDREIIERRKSQVVAFNERKRIEEIVKGAQVKNSDTAIIENFIKR